MKKLLWFVIPAFCLLFTACPGPFEVPPIQPPPPPAPTVEWGGTGYVGTWKINGTLPGADGQPALSYTLTLEYSVDTFLTASTETILSTGETKTSKSKGTVVSAGDYLIRTTTHNWNVATSTWEAISGVAIPYQSTNCIYKNQLYEATMKRVSGTPGKSSGVWEMLNGDKKTEVEITPAQWIHSSYKKDLDGNWMLVSSKTYPWITFGEEVSTYTDSMGTSSYLRSFYTYYLPGDYLHISPIGIPYVFTKQLPD